MINKNLIAERFGKAADTYDSEACIQKDIASEMYSMLDRTRKYGKILEIGCGTGIYSRMLADLDHEELILNDISPEMKQRTTSSGIAFDSFLLGDAENIVFPENISLITSCSAIQWFEDLNAFFRKCYRSLSGDGMIALSSFGKHNLREIRELTGGGLDYMEARELAEIAEANGFRVTCIRQETVSRSFSTPADVLRHLKHTGVTGIRREKWTRADIGRFCREYDKMFGNGNGVPVTYNPIYMIANK